MQNEEIRKRNAEHRAKPLSEVAAAGRTHERRGSYPKEWFKKLGKKLGVSSEKQSELPETASSESQKPPKRVRFSEDVEVIHPSPWFLRGKTGPEKKQKGNASRGGFKEGSDDEEVEKNLRRARTNCFLNKNAILSVSVSVLEPDPGSVKDKKSDR